MFVVGNNGYHRCHDLGITPQDVDKVVEKICQEVGVIFLQKSSWIHPETQVRFLGCTLWSQIDYAGKQKMRDFMKVFDSMYKYFALHQDHLEWLEKELKSQDVPTIVVTHHLPSFQVIHPSFAYQSNSGFATNLEYLFLSKNLRAWICGHTHAPIGYPGEKKLAERSDKVFLIDI